jgi:hypothetical protein
LELVLAVTEGPGLRVELVNRSSSVQRYCHDTFWQSCDITVTDKSGHLMDCDDRRTRMMPDSPISQYAFGSLQPGERTELQDGQFNRSGSDGYDLTWGHCVFYKIPPGAYLAVGMMECQRDSWADKDRKWYTENGVWKGTLRSNEAKVKLP